MDNYSGDGLIMSVYLTAAGWKTVYVPETVQWGLVPDTVKKHRTQRMRWTSIFTAAIGNLWSEHTKGHTNIQQRAGTTILCIVIVATHILIAFSAVAVPLVLFTGTQTVVYQSPRQLQALLYLESLSFLSALVSGFTRSRSGRSYGHIFYDFEQVGVSPFQATAIIRVIISEIIGRKTVSFTPSSKSTQSNTPSWFTLLTQKVDVDLLSCLVVFSAHLAGGYVGLRTFVAAAQNESLFRCFFSQAGYPPFFLLWGKYLLQSGTLIPLMVSSQPIWPLRERLLVRDPVSKVSYPSEEATNTSRIGAAQTFTKLAVFYHWVVLVSAWWIG